MTRTTRNKSAAKSNHITYYANNELCHFWLNHGGWKEAKKTLPQKDYAEARRDRGDSFARHSLNGGVPRWFRNELEKQHRGHTRRELQRFTRNAEYEPMVCKKPSSDEWYYW